VLRLPLSCSLRTNLCVRFKGSVVACGIIFYTGRKLQVRQPCSSSSTLLSKLLLGCRVWQSSSLCFLIYIT
jgi:hypothetical protein